MRLRGKTAVIGLTQSVAADYLASDESRFAAGQALCVDGGMTI